MSTTPPNKTPEESIQASVEEVWYLKPITFRITETDEDGNPNIVTRTIKIITQNYNGPCSFIAICNILLLRGKIQILPPDRSSVSYEFLSQLLGDYLLTSCPEVDIGAALSAMPYTTKGMDLNPLFTQATSFRPSGAGGELALFEQTGIQLVHGWLVDPDSPEYEPVSKTEDYDTSVNLIAEADHLTKGKFVMPEVSNDPFAGAGGSGNAGGSSGQAGSSGHASNSRMKPEDVKKVDDAIIVRRFLDTTQSQLTYYGLFTLASTLAPGTLAALFRNSHLSVLYKSPNPEDSALYALVTDQVFLHETSVVWERLEDVEGGASTFVDSDFVRASPAGGDYAGHTGESALRALEHDVGAMTLEERADQELARQLQAEEESRAQAAAIKRMQREGELKRQQAMREQEKIERKKNKKDCIIM